MPAEIHICNKYSLFLQAAERWKLKQKPLQWSFKEPVPSFLAYQVIVNWVFKVINDYSLFARHKVAIAILHIVKEGVFVIFIEVHK
jgi:hypothetical protein